MTPEEFRSGALQQRRPDSRPPLPGSGPLPPALARRHAERKAAAVATIRPAEPPPKLRARRHADGRTGYPEVVVYETADGTRSDLPPLDGTPYSVVVLDLPACERLRAAGWLEIGHRLPPGADWGGER